MDDLLDAIRAGRVWYDSDAAQFMGRFNARISKELKRLGAHFNSKAKTWGLTGDAVPPDVRIAQVQADATVTRLREEIVKTLDAVHLEAVDKESMTSEEYAATVEKMDAQFKKSVRSIAVAPNLTPKQVEIIAKEWGQNLDLYIKNWAGENILKLREQVQQHVLRGGRAEGLVKTVQENYGVSKRKAKFLARQETSLLMSKFQETRYADVGITEYTWSTSKDERVRPDHKALDGKVFSYSQPPVTNRRTGARNNPGEDFECRCIALPRIPMS